MAVVEGESVVEEEEGTTMRISGLVTDCIEKDTLIGDNIRLDIPDGSSYSPKSSKREASNGGKAAQSVSRPKGSSKGGRRH